MGDAAVAGEAHQLDRVRADQWLAAAEVHLVDPQLGELAQHILPLAGLQLALGVLAPAVAAYAAQVAVLGEEQLGDQRVDVEVGEHVLLDRELGEEPRQPGVLACLHGDLLAATKRLADLNSTPSR